jgi:hypothetical protein
MGIENTKISCHYRGSSPRPFEPVASCYTRSLAMRNNLKIFVGILLIIVLNTSAEIFQKSKSHLKTLCVRGVKTLPAAWVAFSYLSLSYALLPVFLFAGVLIYFYDASLTETRSDHVIYSRDFVPNSCNSQAWWWLRSKSKLVVVIITLRSFVWRCYRNIYVCYQFACCFPFPRHDILSPDAESFVIQFAIQKDIQNYNLACCFVWLWNLVVHIEGGKQAEGFREFDAEEDIWA